MKNPKVTVVGSINMDLTMITDRMPNQGETVLGQGFATYPGGKGANQAVAAASLGAETHMIGAVGQDGFGEQLVSHLNMKNVMTRNIHQIATAPTGTAMIILSNDDNRIIVHSGANHELTPKLIDQVEDIISTTDVLLLQLEIPMETVIYAVQLAKKHHVMTILNPAPYQTLPQELLEAVDYLTPNESEAEAVLKEVSHPDLIQEKLIVTLGKEGVAFYEKGEKIQIPGFSVKVVDTTGAGDTFNGAFAHGLASGKSREEAIRFANACAALSVTHIGAQGGMPTFQEVKRFIQTYS